MAEIKYKQRQRKHKSLKDLNPSRLTVRWTGANRCWQEIISKWRCRRVIHPSLLITANSLTLCTSSSWRLPACRPCGSPRRSRPSLPLLRSASLESEWPPGKTNRHRGARNEASLCVRVVAWKEKSHWGSYWAKAKILCPKKNELIIIASSIWFN